MNFIFQAFRALAAKKQERAEDAIEVEEKDNDEEVPAGFVHIFKTTNPKKKTFGFPAADAGKPSGTGSAEQSAAESMVRVAAKNVERIKPANAKPAIQDMFESQNLGSDSDNNDQKPKDDHDLGKDTEYQQFRSPMLYEDILSRKKEFRFMTDEEKARKIEEVLRQGRKPVSAQMDLDFGRGS